MRPVFSGLDGYTPTRNRYGYTRTSIPYPYPISPLEKIKLSGRVGFSDWCIGTLAVQHLTFAPSRAVLALAPHI